MFNLYKAATISKAAENLIKTWPNWPKNNKKEKFLNGLIETLLQKLRAGLSKENWERAREYLSLIPVTEFKWTKKNQMEIVDIDVEFQKSAPDFFSQGPMLLLSLECWNEFIVESSSEILNEQIARLLVPLLELSGNVKEMKVTEYEQRWAIFLKRFEMFKIKNGFHFNGQNVHAFGKLYIAMANPAVPSNIVEQFLASPVAVAFINNTTQESLDSR